jgi:hypothetical protein
MKKSILSVISVIIVLFLWGCYPQGPDYVEEMDVVLTYHSDTYDFVGKATYAMPDSIVKITGNLVEGDNPKFIPDVTAHKILAMIEENMQAYGWVRVDYDESPDMLLLPASWETTTVFYYYDYWYWWYGGYYPYWGYPPYYYYGGSYSTGTLLMSLIDPEIEAANGNSISQWSGAINGILTDYYDETRLKNGIDKAFDQSSYLQTN